MSVWVDEINYLIKKTESIDNQLSSLDSIYKAKAIENKHLIKQLKERDELIRWIYKDKELSDVTNIDIEYAELIEQIINEG